MAKCSVRGCHTPAVFFIEDYDLETSAPIIRRYCRTHLIGVQRMILQYEAVASLPRDYNNPCRSCPRSGTVWHEIGEYETVVCQCPDKIDGVCSCQGAQI